MEARPGTNLVADLPIAYADVSGLVGSSDLAIGAPYLGVERLHRNSILEAGVRVPIASNNLGAAVGSVTEAVDRLGAFNSNAVVLNLTGTVGQTKPAGFTYRVRAGPRVLIGTEGNDAEMLLDYGGLVGYAAPRYGIEAGLNGWVLLSTDGEIGDRTVHQAGVQLFTPLGRGGRIGALFRLPLDSDTSLASDFTLGLVATIPLSESR